MRSTLTTVRKSGITTVSSDVERFSRVEERRRRRVGRVSRTVRRRTGRLGLRRVSTGKRRSERALTLGTRCSLRLRCTGNSVTLLKSAGPRGSSCTGARLTGLRRRDGETDRTTGVRLRHRGLTVSTCGGTTSERIGERRVTGRLGVTGAGGGGCSGG